MLASVSPSQLMMGKIIGQGLVGLTQLAIWAVCAMTLAGQSARFLPEGVNLSFLTPMLWVYFLLFFALGYVLYSSLYAAAGALCNTLQDAQQIVWPITIFVVIPVALLQVVMQDPDATHNIVLSLIPVFTPILMFMRIVIGNPPLWQIGLSLLLLASTVLLMFQVTGKLFRLGILMYGKAPTWAQIMRMLRVAD
jgi:ABC-2 type transport system permease protein